MIFESSCSKIEYELNIRNVYEKCATQKFAIRFKTSFHRG